MGRGITIAGHRSILSPLNRINFKKIQWQNKQFEKAIHCLCDKIVLSVVSDSENGLELPSGSCTTIRLFPAGLTSSLTPGPYAGFLFGGADEPSGGQWRRRRRRASAAGARIEALAPRGVGAGGGVPLPRQLGGLGERCKLPQWGPGRSPGRF